MYETLIKLCHTIEDLDILGVFGTNMLIMADIFWDPVIWIP